MSKTSFTVYSGFLWITCATLALTSFFSHDAVAQEDNFIKISRPSKNGSSQTLNAQHHFLVLHQKSPSKHASKSNVITLGKDEASKRAIVNALKGESGDAAAPMQLASLDAKSLTPSGHEVMLDSGEVIPFGLAQEDAARVSSKQASLGTLKVSSKNAKTANNKDIKKSSEVEFLPRMGPDGKPVKRISLTMVKGYTGSDGDEEVDEGFYNEILRPQQDQKKFLKIMRREGFLKINGVRVVHGGAGEHASREAQRGVMVTRANNKAQALRTPTPEWASGLEDNVEPVSSDNVSWTWPVAMNDREYISSGFGQRIHPVTGKLSFHQGIDIAAPIGTKVMAAADGVISLVASHKHLGKYVRIEHADGSFSVYGHLSKWNVAEGQVVRAGQEIGAVGTTGRVTGSHLDFSLHINNQVVNPLVRLRVPQEVAQRSEEKILSMR
jgi:murein DD-endopeptidase MepM/ murein hydrolase activator NlpD